MAGWVVIVLVWVVLGFFFWAFLQDVSIVNERWDRAAAEIPEECELCGQRHTDRTRYRCMVCGAECCTSQVSAYNYNLYHVGHCGSVPVWCGVAVEKENGSVCN